jgi:DNA-binding NarL/FixJ family response regulator
VESLKTVIEIRAPDISVVGIAHNGMEAVKLVEKYKPQIVLMDVRMPILDGVEATRVIHEKFPEVYVIMLTTFDDDTYVKKALSYGAVGYLLKDIAPSELIASLRAIKKGPVLISPSVAAKLLDHAYGGGFHKNDSDRETFLKSLSRREREILDLMAQGYDNREIASELTIAEQTVKNHVSIIYDKLGVRDRVQAIQYVIRNTPIKTDHV